MADVEYGAAVQALRNHMGPGYQGTEADGRDQMVSILKQELGYSDAQAHDVIEAMVRSGRLRYRSGAAGEAAAPTAQVGADGAAFTTGSSWVGSPGPVAPEAGYWYIGDDEGEAPERKGQVQPS